MLFVVLANNKKNVFYCNNGRLITAPTSFYHFVILSLVQTKLFFLPFLAAPQFCGATSICYFNILSFTPLSGASIYHLNTLSLYHFNILSFTPLSGASFITLSRTTVRGRGI